jgi:lipopolysaccharide biosynthesis glycosyltransferase
LKTTIVSAADAAYFDLLLDLVHSIRACEESRDVDLCIMDVGLTPQQVTHLSSLVTRVVATNWDLDFAGRDQCPSWFKAMICRPHLPRYFPDYDLLVWIDSDAWLCNWDAMKLLIYAGGTYGFAIVPEVDRSYLLFEHDYPHVRATVKEAYLRAFGPEAAEEYGALPVFNSGVLSIRRDSNLWEVWAELLTQALSGTISNFVEQSSINVAIYSGRVRAYFLPSWCNWLSGNATPILDPATRKLLVPLLPHEPISICHLTYKKRDKVRIACLDGVFRDLPLTYDSIRLAALPPLAID